MMYMLSTTIRVSRKTKELLTRVMLKLEGELGRRLDYDDVIRILIERSGELKPMLLQKLKEMSIPEELVSRAREMLREERRREEVFERRISSRYKHSH